MEKENDEKIKKSVKNLLDLQADLYTCRDDDNRCIDAIDAILGVVSSCNYTDKNKSTNYENLNFSEKRAIEYANKLVKLKNEGITVILGKRELYTIETLLEIINKISNDNDILRNKSKSKSKKRCTDNEWKTCEVEKRGCQGCFYDDGTSKNETPKTKKLSPLSRM